MRHRKVLLHVNILTTPITLLGMLLCTWMRETDIYVFLLHNTNILTTVIKYLKHRGAFKVARL